MKQTTYYYLLIWVASLLMASCTQEIETTEISSLGPNDVQISLPVSGVSAVPGSRATVPMPGTPEEDVVNSLQLFLFNGSTLVKTVTLSEQNPNQDDHTVWNRATQTVVLRGLDTKQAYTIYAIANHTLSGIATEADIMAAFTQRSTQIEPPLPTLTQGLVMSGKVEGHDFKSHSNKVTIELIRQVAKMQLILKMDPAFFAAYPGIVWASDKENIPTEPNPLSVAIYNLASHSYIYPRNNAATPPVIVIPGDAASISYGPLSVKTTDGEWPVVTGYIYENSFADKKIPATYAIVNLPYRMGSSVVNRNYYRMQFSEPDGSPFKLLRNNLYQVTATVTGFGLKNPPKDGNLLSELVVKPWTGYTVNGDVDDVKLSIASNPVVDFINGASGEIKFWTNQTSNINIELEGTFVYSDGTPDAKVKLNDYFDNLAGTKSIDTGKWVITVSPTKDKGYQKDVDKVKIWLNVSGLRKEVTLSFRHVLDITKISGATTTRSSYNSLTGGAGANGLALTEAEASSDAKEPPYAKLEIASANTGMGFWSDALAMCDRSKGWRAPRIREAHYMYSNIDNFPLRFNFTSFDRSRMYSSTDNFPNSTTKFLWAGFGITGADASIEYKSSTQVFFRCVREIQ